MSPIFVPTLEDELAAEAAPPSTEEFRAILDRLSSANLAIAVQILERLEQCHSLREGGIAAPIPTPDDVMERAR